MCLDLLQHGLYSLKNRQIRETLHIRLERRKFAASSVSALLVRLAPHHRRPWKASITLLRTTARRERKACLESEEHTMTSPKRPWTRFTCYNSVLRLVRYCVIGPHLRQLRAVDGVASLICVMQERKKTFEKMFSIAYLMNSYDGNNRGSMVIICRDLVNRPETVTGYGTSNCVLHRAEIYSLA
jgi:hypothetical protein